MKVIRETTLRIDFSELLHGMDNDVADVCEGVNPFHVDCELRRDAEGDDISEPSEQHIVDMVVKHIGRDSVRLRKHMRYIVKGLIAEETERAERGELFEDEY